MNIWMFAFLLLPIAALSYIGWHIWCLLPLSWIWKILAVALLVGSFLLMFLNIGRVIDHLPLSVATASYEIGNSSIFVLLYVFMLFLVLDLGRLIHLLPRTLFYNNWWTAGAVFAFVFMLFLYGNLHYQDKYRQELTIGSQKITKPVKLVMMSDLHLGYHNRRSEFHRWVDMVNAEHPDMVLIAGDIIDMSMRPLIEENMAEEFRRLEAPVYACLGNHEYYSGEPEAQRFYRDAGIRLLQDDVATVGELAIIGRDDRTNLRRDSLATLTQRTDMQKFTILLDHQPYRLDQAERMGIDFQFSGHTHHGQVWPISWITESIYECAFGEHRRGATRYYVSSGIGIWGGKFRIGTRSEYVVLNLQ